MMRVGKRRLGYYNGNRESGQPADAPRCLVLSLLSLRKLLCHKDAAFTLKRCRGTTPQNFQAQPLGVAKSNSSHYRLSRVLQELETLYVGEAAPYPTQVAGVRFHGGHALIQFEDIATRTVGRTSQLLASRHPADGERSKRVDSPEKRSAASVVSVALFDVLQGNAPSLIPPHRDGASSVPRRRAG